MSYSSPPAASGILHRHYWSESAHERTEFLTELVDRLNAERVPTTVHEGWVRSDLDVFTHGWTSLGVCTVQEDHSGGRRLLRVRIGLRPNAQMTWTLGGGAVLALVALVTPATSAILVALTFAGLAAVAWRVGLDRRARLIALADEAAEAVGLLSMQPSVAARPEVSLDGVLEGLRTPALETAAS